MRNLFLSALTFFLVSTGLGLGIRSLANARVENEIVAARIFMSTLRKGRQAELLDAVYAGDPEQMREHCRDLLRVREELRAASLYGPTFAPLASAEGEASALSSLWTKTLTGDPDAAYAFVQKSAEGRRLVYLTPLKSGKNVLAFLRMDFDLSEIDGGRRLMLYSVVVAVLLTLFVSLALNGLFSKGSGERGGAR